MAGNWLVIVVFVYFIKYSLQISSRQDLSYVAGVVEYSPERMGANPERVNIAQYIGIINSKDADATDIIVFPESTISDKSMIVPDPADKVIPCDNDELDEILRNISCTAKSSKKYIVINLTEKSECTEDGQAATNDFRLCSSTGYNIYNTNVAFDRNGEIIARYRKFNLFGEPGKNITLAPEISMFETDFGVTFGLMTCFDLLFENPSKDLRAQGVNNIIFPAMWFSELPFLTAVQIQLYWAFRMNVNLLAAGANTPSVGSTGSGIYNGRNGALATEMSFVSQTRLIVAKVPKITGFEGSIKMVQPEAKLKVSPKDMLNLKLMRDFLELFNTKLLDLTQGLITEKICYYAVCCEMEIAVRVNEVAENQETYRYRAVIFDGVRTFSGFVTAGIATCGIVACTTDELESCGERFNETVDENAEAIVFDSISIVGTFRGGSHVMMLPNSLNTDIMPLDVECFKYDESLDYSDQNGIQWRNVQIELLQPRSRLLTFGIWGRNFNKDGESVSEIYDDAGSAGKKLIFVEMIVGALSVQILLRIYKFI